MKSEGYEGTKLSPNSFDQNIPTNVVIGVTGHRKLGSAPSFANDLKTAIERISQVMPRFKKTLLQFTILSPLAEGADRMVVREILRIPNSVLEVILPFEKDDYVKDFKTTKSKAEFEELLSHAKSIKVLPYKDNRNEAYAQVGLYVVDHCDVLIALWNGLPAAGRGGTQEVVKYAKEIKRPLIWINTEKPGKVTFAIGEV
jgi:hypothetical protein